MTGNNILRKERTKYYKRKNKKDGIIAGDRPDLVFGV